MSIHTILLLPLLFPSHDQKRKLNSKNPKYYDKSQVIKQLSRVQNGTTKVRNSSGNLTGNTVEVKGVWYE